MTGESESGPRVPGGEGSCLPRKRLGFALDPGCLRPLQGAPCADLQGNNAVRLGGRGFLWPQTGFT